MRKQLIIHILLTLNLLPMTQAFALAKAPQSNRPSPIEKCLNVATNLTSDCLNQNLKIKTLNSCYELSEKIYSNQSKENVRNYCFYNISEFPSLNSCVSSAKKFYIAENKDQALFECVRQFEAHINQKSCLEISKMMIYKDKRQYLADHCASL